jgi:hypothetical protein
MSYEVMTHDMRAVFQIHSYHAGSDHLCPEKIDTDGDVVVHTVGYTQPIRDIVIKVDTQVSRDTMIRLLKKSVEMMETCSAEQCNEKKREVGALNKKPEMVSDPDVPF